MTRQPSAWPTATDEQRPDDPSGMPAALAFVVVVAGAAGGIGVAVWLGAVQCIRIGGCG